MDISITSVPIIWVLVVFDLGLLFITIFKRNAFIYLGILGTTLALIFQQAVLDSPFFVWALGLLCVGAVIGLWNAFRKGGATD